VAVITEAAVRELAGFRGQDAPVTSCYLDVDGRRLSRRADCEHELERVLRSARSRANGTTSVARDLQRIEEYVRGGIDRSTTRGLAIFSCSAHDFWKVVSLPVPVRSRVVINEAPAVSQLESVTQGFDRFAVLLADRQRARILVFHFGELVDHSELLDERPRDEDTHGHLDRGDAASRSDAQVSAHLRRAADVAFAMFQSEAFEHLTLGGPEPVVRAMEATVHPYLQRRLCQRIAVGVSAGMGDIREAVLDVEREVERQREAQAVARLRQAVASRQPAVVGLADVLGVVGEHRVDRLLVSSGYSEAGWTCRHCGHLGLVGRTCPTCSGELTPVDDIVEQTVELALAQSCQVEICVDNPDLDVMGRIGALLRY
jgi:peptide chain release factor subunit 1